MEDLYKDNPNSWLMRARFSNTVYRRPDPSQLPVVSLEELKLWHSDLNSKWAAATRTVTQDNTSNAIDQSTTITTLKPNPDSSLTSEELEGSNSKTNRTEPASKNKALSGMFKALKDTVRRNFAGPPSRERTGSKTVKSSSGLKKESLSLSKYFDRQVHQVSTLEKSGEDH